MQWFRMYSEARNDAKLRYLSDAEFRVWFNLLCLSNEQEERGVIPPMSRKLLSIEVSGGDEDLLQATLSKLIELSIIAEDDSGITFINFTKRQYDYPSDTPEATRERKRRSRQTKKAKEDVPPMSHPCHEMSRDVTTKSRDVTTKSRLCHEMSRLYSDTDNTNTVQYSTSTPPLPPPTPNGAGEGGGGEKESSSPKTIDELIDEATRYTAEQRAIIREYWDTVRFTRRRGAVAPSIVKTELEYWERFPPDIVLEALNIHLTKYRNKREEYTRGIMRRLQEERRNGGDFNHTAENRENHGRPGNRARTRTARTSACDYIGGKYGAIFEKERQAVHSTTSGSLDSE